MGLAKSSQQPTSQVARDLGINANMLNRWCRELHEVDAQAFRGQGKARDEELARLRREPVQVKKEWDFLQEAVAFFAKEDQGVGSLGD